MVIIRYDVVPVCVLIYVVLTILYICGTINIPYVYIYKMYIIYFNK